MLNFADIERLIQDQHRALVLQPALGEALRQYRSAGGDKTARPWLVAGIYTYLAKNKRLVLEALYVEKLDTCVVLVFQEQPLKILYARKAIGKIEACSHRIEEAVKQLQLHMPSKPLSIRRFEPEGPWGVTPFLPIPPPVNLSKVPE